MFISQKKLEQLVKKLVMEDGESERIAITETITNFTYELMKRVHSLEEYLGIHYVETSGYEKNKKVSKKK